jgi:hypothetical protein
MESMKSKLSLFVAVALGLGSVAHAHHSGAVYDESKRHTFTGTLTKIEWVSPHVLIHLDVRDADGKMKSWTFEGPPPSWYRHQNLKLKTMEDAIGQTVQINGAPARDGTLLAQVGDIKFADGAHYNVFAGAPYGPPIGSEKAH